jgi:S-adenosylmethionine:tRNA ribosyltransferase-isomerase
VKRQDFHYELPEELIAHYPSQQRTACRLLALNGRDGALSHLQFTRLRELLDDGDLLVFNNTKVIPARLYGQKATGGKVELLIERVLDDRRLLSQIKASKAMKAGAEFQVLDHDGNLTATFTVLGREDSFFRIELQGEQPLDDVLKACGHMPLPPYIKREDEELDQERYQTVYAKRSGAVAAPTAGLHFDDAMIEALKADGINTCEVTLHVGAGTYQPVRVDDISEHKMHSEYAELDAETAELIRATHAAGKRVIAVGTTSMRCLESAAKYCEGEFAAWRGDTDIFITPGYRFQVVDALITNFHLPESTLLMLVSALAGRDNIMRAYQEAVAAEYQFFSYGDAMFIQGALPSASASENVS